MDADRTLTLLSVTVNASQVERALGVDATRLCDLKSLSLFSCSVFVSSASARSALSKDRYSTRCTVVMLFQRVSPLVTG